MPDHRAANSSILLADALVRAFAMFLIKESSLLAFDERRLEEPESLHGVYAIDSIPCDFQSVPFWMRFRPPFRILRTSKRSNFFLSGYGC
ncbi:MAG: hypothetical protein CSA33_00665 [Desulfobulbus propionicus]|nr:MAG: hypothetical protein CSA33_00665 [Desulfobulbus propionicus]